MIVYVFNQASMATPNLSFGDNNLLGEPLSKNVTIAPAKEANVHQAAFVTEQKIGGALNCTHLPTPLPNGRLLPF